MQSQSHIYRVVMSFCVACIPGWATQWRESKIVRLNLLGTYVCGTPVDISQIIVAFEAGISKDCTLRDEVFPSWMSSESTFCSAAMSAKSIIGQ